MGSGRMARRLIFAASIADAGFLAGYGGTTRDYRSRGA